MAEVKWGPWVGLDTATLATMRTSVQNAFAKGASKLKLNGDEVTYRGDDWAKRTIAEMTAAIKDPEGTGAGSRARHVQTVYRGNFE